MSRSRSPRECRWNVDYIRRSWGNLPATINRAWTPADFDAFVYNVPKDPLLRGWRETADVL